METKYTKRQIAEYLGGWTLGSWGEVGKLGQHVTHNALSQLEDSQDGIDAYFSRRRKSSKVPFLWPTIVCLIVWIVIAFCMTSCTPAFTMPGFSVEGNFADYNYSAKDNRWTIRPRTTVIQIRDEK